MPTWAIHTMSLKFNQLRGLIHNRYELATAIAARSFFWLLPVRSRIRHRRIRTRRWNFTRLSPSESHKSDPYSAALVRLVMKYTPRCGIGVWFTRLTLSLPFTERESGCTKSTRLHPYHRENLRLETNPANNWQPLP